MTYIIEKLETQQTGSERPLITIEFYPDVHPKETEYSYEHPLFVFGDRVILKNEYPKIEYVVVGMKIIESKTSTGKLLTQPRWKYEITNGEVSYQKEESALIRSESPSFDLTCKGCQHFEDYREPEFFQVDGKSIPNNNKGKGWCNCFDRPAKTHHIKTNDCIRGREALEESSQVTLNEIIELDRDDYPIEADSSNSTFQVGSIVKIIDQEEDHSEWGVFEVVKVVPHDEHFNSLEKYLDTHQWYFLLISHQRGDEALWVGEGEICAADMSHNICTLEVF